MKIRDIERIINNMSRNFKNSEFAFKVHTGMFVFSFFVFGVFGIFPLSKVLKTKALVLREMYQHMSTMTVNLALLENAEKDLANSRESISLLNEYMPQETNAQTYMLAFIQAVGEDGFDVKNFTQNTLDQTTGSAGSGQVQIDIRLEGTGYPADLVKHIETLKRVTQVTKMYLDKDNEGKVGINLSLKIYNIII